MQSTADWIRRRSAGRPAQTRPAGFFFGGGGTNGGIKRHRLIQSSKTTAYKDGNMQRIKIVTLQFGSLLLTVLGYKCVWCETCDKDVFTSFVWLKFLTFGQSLLRGLLVVNTEWKGWITSLFSHRETFPGQKNSNIVATCVSLFTCACLLTERISWFKPQHNRLNY